MKEYLPLHCYPKRILLAEEREILIYNRKLRSSQQLIRFFQCKQEPQTDQKDKVVCEKSACKGGHFYYSK